MSKRGNGEGSIYYSDKLNRWVAQCYINDKRKSFYGKTRKEANDKMINAKSEEIAGTFLEKNEITIGNLAEEIIEDKLKSNTVNQNSYKRLTYTLKHLEPIANTPLQKVSPKIIKDYLNSITYYSNETIAKIYQLLNQTFRRAIDRGYINKNPMLSEEVKKPKSNILDKEVISLSIEEEKMLLQALSCETSPYKNIIYLMLFTGMRIGEVLALTHKSFDDKFIYIKNTLTRDTNDKTILGKTTKTSNSKRSIPISNDVRFILDNIKSKHDLLFYDEKNDTIITPSEVNSYLHRLNDKYKIAPKLHNHILRHTFATRCIEAGMNIKVISNLLGHKKIDTTLNTYASVLEKFALSDSEKLDKYLLENNIGLH